MTSLSLIRSLRAGRRPAASRAAGLHGVIQQVALPAASIIAIALLSGGVSAVVTGDPMAPIDGVQRIASQLPGFGGDDSKGTVKALESDLDRAESAAKNQNVGKANEYLTSARGKLPGVPDDEKPRLQAAIKVIQDALPVTPAPLAPSAPVTPVATPEPSATATPDASTPPSITPTPSVTDPAPSTTTPPATPSPSGTAPAAPVTSAPVATGVPAPGA